ncbi:plasmid partitioning protein RepB [Gemmobacter sp.]|uniref:plasmid partitioning protein RepB n=1 Tax=Gemmobacter sp. TaxID=1898957 RepID=UPI002B0033A8|nr:plasmid partitioning protein RepB [Gemmobacter sp.]
MARKDVLKGLMGQPAEPADLPQRPTRGAIGAVSRSIADLKARAVVELDPAMIDAGGLTDRLETDEAEDSTLRASIAEYGQQVPVLVRPHPEIDGRFQIVYGRRRVLAMRDLGQPVKALIRDLDDRELVLAQGQENTARRDLSFIEKVNFARQMEQHGYERKVICDALSVDKTLVSRMLSVAERIPPDLIATIGAAPSVGRDRWTALADLIAYTEVEAEDVAPMITVNAASPRSDDRFQAAWDYLITLRNRRRRAGATPQEPRRVFAADGLPLGQVKFDRNFCTLKLRLANTDGFEDWLLDNLPALHADWQKSHPPEDAG